MPKISRDGEIIRPKKKPEKTDGVGGAKAVEVSVEEMEKMVPVNPETNESVIPVMYGFSIRCATVSSPGFDMEEVCKHCPFGKATKCVDTMLLPTETQEMDIARILMLSEGDEE